MVQAVPTQVIDSGDEIDRMGLADVLRELGSAGEQRRALVVREVELVESARAGGASWRLVADVLGVTPQAVQQRYGSRIGGRW